MTRNKRTSRQEAVDNLLPEIFRLVAAVSGGDSRATECPTRRGRKKKEPRANSQSPLHLMSETTVLGLHALMQLVQVSTDQARAVLDRCLGIAPASQAHSKPRRIVVRGELGNYARGQFMLEQQNPLGGPVRFVVSPFRPLRPPFDPMEFPLVVVPLTDDSSAMRKYKSDLLEAWRSEAPVEEPVPPPITMCPGERRVFLLEVDLRDVREPSAIGRYRGELRVKQGQMRPVPILIEILPPLYPLLDPAGTPRRKGEPTDPPPKRPTSDLPPPGAVPGTSGTTGKGRDG